MTEATAAVAERVVSALESARGDVDTLRVQVLHDVEEVRKELDEVLRLKAGSRLRIETPDFDAFQREPYCVVPVGKERWRVVVPKFVDFHVGMLERATDAYNVFVVDRFSKWLGGIPKEMESLFSFGHALEATVQDGLLTVKHGKDQEKAFERYRKHLTIRRDERTMGVKAGSEFDLIADMIADGTLPFVPRPVDAEDLRSPAWMPAGTTFDGRPRPSGAITLRPYQEEAWTEFKRFGACGIYWPPSAGKTIIGLHAFAHLRGPKLVVVPTSTLVEQWTERLKRHLEGWAAAEVEVVTYQGWDKIKRRLQQRGARPYTLVVFDECHALPANTFARWSTVPCKYRLGLSATPYREDGRTDYIFALTGHPVGLDWQELVKLGLIGTPDVRVVLHKDPHGKVLTLQRLLADKKRTLVFCDSLQLGEQMSRLLGIPFVHGGTAKRLDVVRRNPQVICSRVGDEGMSLEDLERVVELDFLFGSRRQEGQRLGRLFHSGGGEHWILMTDQELEDHDKRLLAITEKGFRVKFEREAA